MFYKEVWEILRAAYAIDFPAPPAPLGEAEIRADQTELDALVLDAYSDRVESAAGMFTDRPINLDLVNHSIGIALAAKALRASGSATGEAP